MTRLLVTFAFIFTGQTALANTTELSENQGGFGQFHANIGTGYNSNCPASNPYC